jgi:hypothetical protein
MFKVIEHHMESGLTELEALDKARTIYNSIMRPCGKKPGIKDLNVAFKKEMDRLAIKSKGRPRKPRRGKKRFKEDSSLSSEAFAKTFELSPDEEWLIAEERKEEEMRKAQMEQQRQKDNNQGRWDYVHRNYPAGSYPAMAPLNYGTIHPTPFRPHQGQPQFHIGGLPGHPEIELPALPPGHQYATLPNI